MTLAIADDLDMQLPIEPSRAAQLLLYAIAALLAVALVWASLAKIDRVTRGEGRIVPSNHLQKVQYLEGGIIKEILVRPGDAVKKDDVLVRVDPTQINAKLTQGRDGYYALGARIARLEAAASGAPLRIPAEIAAAAPAIVANETTLYQTRRQEYEAALAIEQAKLDDAVFASNFAAETQTLAEEELGIVGPLVTKGIEPRIELIRARQRSAAALGEMQRAGIAVKSAESEVARVRNTFYAGIADELAKARAEMSGVAGDLPGLRDRADRTDVKAPIDGLVHRVLVATIGGVVQPGETIVEVVPAGDTPLVEAKVKPSDIGFLRIGQDARVKISAYDSSVYGSLPGKIETISPDAIEDPKDGARHFLVTVRLDEAALASAKGSLPPMPGMAAQVDILNGKRTVLAYLMKPIAELSDNALRED
ncbi:MAG: HlyD family type I secretion periplasmic adaptor subunit [Parvularculaceae bacterium]